MYENIKNIDNVIKDGEKALKNMKEKLSTEHYNTIQKAIDKLIEVKKEQTK